jgi:hypothetical protein
MITSTIHVLIDPGAGLLRDDEGPRAPQRHTGRETQKLVFDLGSAETPVGLRPPLGEELAGRRSTAPFKS